MVISGLIKILRDESVSKTRLNQTVVCGVLGSAMLTGCATIQTTKPETSYGVPVTDRTIAQRILDKSIENTAKTNINAMDPTLYQRSRIGVDSFYSEVLLTGEVPDEQTKKQVMQIVTSMPDVKQAYDYLTVGPQKGTSYTVHDGYISSKVNAKILANNAISTSQVKVVTDDGIVYVMGKLTPTQRGHLMNIVERTVGIKELVLLTELIDDYGNKIDEDKITQEEGLEPPDKRYIIEDSVAIPASQYNTPVEPSGNQSNNSQSNTSQPSNVGNTSSQPNTAQSNNAQGSTYQPLVTGSDGLGGPYASPYIEMYKQEVPGW